MADEKVEASYYDKLKSEDLIEWARPLIEGAGYRLRFGDGKLVPDTSMHHDTPWHHTNMTDRLDCGMHMSIMWKVIFTGLGRDWVPSFCQECWKVVARPKTLLQLFAVEGVQEKMQRPSKCGIEVRPEVHGLYGAYWYNDSVESGRECYAAVRKAIDEDPVLGPDVDVLLKRACTEFERRGGPSDKWTVTPAQEHVEEIVHRLIKSNTNFSPQAKHMVTRVHRKWIEYAYANADETYAYFTGGEPLFPPYVTYHEEPKPKPKPKKKKGSTGTKPEKSSGPVNKKGKKK